MTDVRRYSMDDLPNKAVAFEVGFENRSDAVAACRKYDGVLADGRVLKVVLQNDLKTQNAQTAQATQAIAPKAIATGAATSANANLPIDVRRRLAEAEARFLKEQEAIIKNKGAASRPQSKAEKLSARIGPLPLAQRLAAEVPVQAASDKAGKRKRRQQRTSMQVDK